MALFRKKPKTSTQKAQKAQMGIFVRLVGCAYLIYIVVQLLTTAPEDDTLSPTLKIVISVFFLLAAAAVIFITVLDFVRNLKYGTYKTASYTDDIIEAYAAKDEPEFSPPANVEESQDEETEKTEDTFAEVLENQSEASVTDNKDVSDD